jgi:lipopolysaccharide export system protein LptA
MAFSPPDCRARGFPSLLAAAAALLFFQPTDAASEKCDTTKWTTGWEKSRSTPGSASIDELKASQCNTLLQASKAETSNFEDAFKNGTWVLSGKVHLEFDGAVLDTDAATVVLVDGRLSAVNAGSGKAQSPPAKKAVHAEFKGVVLDADTAAATFAAGRIKTIQALGAPAQFSYLRKSGQRVRGRSPRILYDEGKTLISFFDAWFSSDTEEGEAELLTYNFTDEMTDMEKFIGTRDTSKRVPAPRTPDRATAK